MGQRKLKQQRKLNPKSSEPKVKLNPIAAKVFEMIPALREMPPIAQQQLIEAMKNPELMQRAAAGDQSVLFEMMPCINDMLKSKPAE